jgi:host factor-I protein
MLRLTREGQPNLFIYKHQIRSISEFGRKRAPRSESAAGRDAIGNGADLRTSRRSISSGVAS